MNGCVLLWLWMDAIPIVCVYKTLGNFNSKYCEVRMRVIVCTDKWWMATVWPAKRSIMYTMTSMCIVYVFYNMLMHTALCCVFCVCLCVHANDLFNAIHKQLNLNYLFCYLLGEWYRLCFCTCTNSIALFRWRECTFFFLLPLSSPFPHSFTISSPSSLTLSLYRFNVHVSFILIKMWAVKTIHKRNKRNFQR